MAKMAKTAKTTKIAKIAKMTKNVIFDFFGCVLREENNSVRTQNGQNGQNDKNKYFRKSAFFTTF